MRDAMGGTVIIVIIVVFIVIVSGYLAFNVNYTKAFRMKNKIISYYDDYNGECVTSGECKRKIHEYANDIGYHVSDLKCPVPSSSKTRVYNVDNLYCAEEFSSSESGGDISSKKYYKISTKINIDVPVFKFISTMKFFEISGNTKTYIKR